jgi:hypothetical protein
MKKKNELKFCYSCKKKVTLKNSRVWFKMGFIGGDLPEIDVEVYICYQCDESKNKENRND